jgi:hypothetical protein
MSLQRSASHHGTMKGMSSSTPSSTRAREDPMAAAMMTRWSEARRFYSFFMCFRLVLYWMILDLYWTCGELDVLF